MKKKSAIIIGAGPAGLTAAEQLLKRTEYTPVVLEAESQPGGISKTINYNGNRIDFGGHRFFSKSDRVMNWWLEKMPPEKDDQNKQILNPDDHEKIMLVKQRLSRIFYIGKFFDYPVSLNKNTIYSLGLRRIINIGFSYLWIKLFPKKKENNLEDFFINRFGKTLYKTFFKDYTEKVWGVPCTEINPEWGGQRIKGLSVSKAITDAVKSSFKKNKHTQDEKTETSLIKRFHYPKYGPGQMWEVVADEIELKGGKIKYNYKAENLITSDKVVKKVIAKNTLTGEEEEFIADLVISTMPVIDLIKGMKAERKIKEIAEGLIYRDFITVGLLLDKLKIEESGKLIKDNWIYVQEPSVKVGRLQFFHNWSPYLVADKNKKWIGLEYFCNEGDDFWGKDDDEIINLASEELDKIRIINKKNIIDATIHRLPKAYPAYFGTYNQFDEIKKFVNDYRNLFLAGRNGMHKYNNQDHSMLTSMMIVDNLVNNNFEKENIWNVNTEEEYHESK